MDLKLIRNTFCSDGVFGVLRRPTGEQVAVTLEHAYPGIAEPISYIPKLPPGEYQCVRGMHRLHRMNSPFETFEVTHVPGHSGILFHVGNTNGDSEGCILLGSDRFDERIALSRFAFDAFMVLQDGVDVFTLTVE